MLIFRIAHTAWVENTCMLLIQIGDKQRAIHFTKDSSRTFEEQKQSVIASLEKGIEKLKKFKETDEF